MLDMTRQNLADASHVSHSALSDFERNRRQPGLRTLATVRAAFEAAGVRFIDGDEPGVILAKVRTLPEAMPE